MSIQENALQDFRAEFATETTTGEFPTDPDFTRYSDYIASAPGWGGGVETSENNALGSGDVVEITRGQEEHPFDLEYWLQRAPVDGSGNAQDPIAIPFIHDYSGEIESHTILFRREVTEGGNFDSGFRMFTVGAGCKPLEATIPGDPGEASPQSLELGYDSEYGNSHVIHQPDTGTTLDVINNGSTSVDVTIEDEGASTTETVTVAGSSTVTTTATFADVDVIYIASGTPDGDINVTDGSGTDILEEPLRGTSNTDPDFDRGIPPLGSGSRGSAISSDPERFLGLNTAVTRGGNNLAERIHSFDLSAELDSDDPAVIGTRQGPIDEGTRTVTLEADVAGPYESTAQVKDHLQGTVDDIVVVLGGTDSASGVADITLNDAQSTDVDEQTYGAGDANFIFGTTFTAQNNTGNAVSITNTT
jgi:hypothetical protein